MSENLEFVAKWDLRFGKYKGKTYGDLVETKDGRDYLSWCLRNSVIRNEKAKAYIRSKFISSCT